MYPFIAHDTLRTEDTLGAEALGMNVQGYGKEGRVPQLSGCGAIIIQTEEALRGSGAQSVRPIQLLPIFLRFGLLGAVTRLTKPYFAGRSLAQF